MAITNTSPSAPAAARPDAPRLGAALPLLLTAALCALYVALRTSSIDGDGVLQIDDMVRAHGHRAVNPRYTLYFPFIGLFVGRTGLNDPLGYIRRLQTANTLLAAVALPLVFWLVSYWTRNRKLAVAVMAGVGVSFAFWNFAMNVGYALFAFTALLGSLALPAALARRGVPLPLAAALSGLGAAAAALCYLGNLSAGPALLWTLWDGYRARTTARQRAWALLPFGGTLLLIAAGGVAVSILDGTVSGPAAFAHWIGQRNNYPGWSEFRADTPRRALSGFLCAFQDYYTGLHLRELRHGKVTPSLLPAQVSLAAVVLMVLAIPAAWLTAGRRLWREAPRLWTFCALWFVPAALFNAFQAADDYKFWINTLVSVFIVGFLSLQRLCRRDVFVCVPALLLLGNLSTPIWGRHDPSNLADITTATQAGHFLRPADLALSPTYGGWTADLPAFAHRQEFTLMQVADRNATPQQTERRLEAELQAVRARGGRVYIAGLDAMGDAQWDWVQSATGLPRRVILDHVGPVRWTYGRQSLWEYRDARPAGRSPGGR